MRHLFLAILLVTTACEKKSLEKEWEEVISALPWMMDVLNYCENYKATKAPADRNDLASMVSSHVRNASAKNVRGVLEKLLPPSDEQPDEYSIQVLIGNRVRFATESKDKPIKKGDKVFEQVAPLKQGDCVMVSASDFKAIATFQQGRVCDPRYYARFTDIRPCN